ncbi:MAG: cytochrome c [Hydrogenophaga sp.]|nr:cytochrome c [Hydrogenophaga sp.]
MSVSSSPVVRRLLWVVPVTAVVLSLAVVALLVRQLNVDPLPPLASAPATASAEQVERGAYLARVGNCAACHTARGGAPYAGGHAIHTPFGPVYAGNLTPDPTHGLGAWSADAFWRAMRHGQSRDGRLLNPVFPYENFTLISREDSDALYAFLQSLPPVAQPNQPHGLRFPYNTQAALAVWRELYFEPASFKPDPTRPADWNQGAYLVRGLGHCAACHSPRDALGGIRQASVLSGGLMPGQGWYAPSLQAHSEAGVAQWSAQQVVELLKTGVLHGVDGGVSVMGPMADVVFQSTQHLSDDDLHAMAVYLQSLPPREPVAVPAPRASAAQLALGEQVYQRHCADCHGANGQGAAFAYPALAGNRAVTQASHVNPVQAILSGGFAPATAGNPQPYGMPPYRTLLTDLEIAAVASFIRQSWGNQAGAVTVLNVQRVR